MTLRLQLFLIISTIIALFIITNMIRKESIELKYSMTWLFTGIGLIVIALFPSIIEWLSLLIGIKTPVNALFLIALTFQLVIIFALTIALSRNSNRIKKVAQELALLKKSMEEFRK